MKINRRTAIKTSILSGLGLLIGQGAMAQNCLTTDDIEGPYYIPGSPHTTKLSPAGANGTPLFITGSVYAKDCTTPITNAVVDVWHANDAGGYENDNYRGIIKTDGSGKYSYETILPGKYLNGSQYRPRHLHYKVSAPELNNSLVLTTQIYFEGDSSISIDPWASDPDAEERIIPLSTDAQGAEHGVADFVINVEGKPNGINDGSNGNRSSIESIYPNPVSDNSELNIALTDNSQVDINVYNLNGQEVSNVVRKKRMSKGKYKFPLPTKTKHGLRLAPGIYIIQLKQDGLLKDVKRFVIQ